MTYVQGFVAAVPRDGKAAYRAYAAAAARLFRELGATRCVECWADDVPHGTRTDFWRAVDAGEGEVVVFSWIEFPSKEVAEATMHSMMIDPRWEALGRMPFDGSRMIFGGFTPILDA